MIPDKDLTDDVLDEIIAGAKTAMEQYLALSLKAERAAISASVPDECPYSVIESGVKAWEEFETIEDISRVIWNACRAAMLQSEPQNAPQNIPENIPAGYVLAPVELLSDLRDFAHPEIEKYCQMWAGRRDAEFPTMRKIISDADELLAAAPKGV